MHLRAPVALIARVRLRPPPALCAPGSRLGLDDGDAPIFAQADYGVVDNLHEVLPALTRTLR